MPRSNNTIIMFQISFSLIQATIIRKTGSENPWNKLNRICTKLQFAPSGGRKCVFQRPLCGAERPLVFS